MSNPNPVILGPFNSSAQILTLGDGDLSFSLALATQLGGRNITATVFDSREECIEKYDTFRANEAALASTGASCHTAVDATALAKQPWLQPHAFDRIVFNFPHVGGSTESDIRKNQRLLRQVMASARSILAPHQRLIISLRDTPFYASWKIEEQAFAVGMQLDKTEPEVWPFAQGASGEDQGARQLRADLDQLGK